MDDSQQPKQSTRTPPAFVTTGLGFAIVGAAVWIWSIATDRSTPVLAVSFVAVGLVFAAIGAFIGRRNRA